MAAPDPSASDFACEAARYALLRRLAPSMRHHLVVPLQPIGMVYEIMDRRLRAPQPNIAEIREGAHKINTYARSALASSVDVITWLSPDDDARVTAIDGLKECLSLVQTGFTFRGFTLRDELGDVQGEVKRSAFRYVVIGALVYLSDDNPPPAQITITGRSTPDAVDIIMTVGPSAGEQTFATAPTYRPISLRDVEALASAEGVQVRREGAGLRVSLPSLKPKA